MVTIDGSFGEGGGQILRTSLALSMVTGRAVAISNVRARRAKPGLRRQHLTAASAAAELCGAQLDGAKVGSTELTFVPGSVRAGDYTFAIGTAGSTTLVLQTLLPPLLLADGPSTLTLQGGTHNPQAPPFDFLAHAYLPLINQMGPDVSARLDRCGFYPAGGGQITVSIDPAEELGAIDLLQRGRTVACRATAIVANLPEHIAQRELNVVQEILQCRNRDLHVRTADAHGPGNVLIVECQSEHATEVFTGFGQRGVRAEKVAANVVRQVQRYRKANVPVSEHLADQLLLPMALGAGGRFRTMPLTPHATTNIHVIRQFLDVDITAGSNDDGNLTVEVHR